MTDREPRRGDAIYFHEPEMYDAPVAAIVTDVLPQGTPDLWEVALIAFPPPQCGNGLPEIRTKVRQATGAYGPGWSWPQ